MEGYDKSGITIMYMDEGMDSGDIISQREVMIEEDDTLDTLSAKLMKVGSELLIETLPSIIEGTNASRMSTKLLSGTSSKKKTNF